MMTLALGLDFGPFFQILVAVIFFAVWYVVIRRAVRDGIGDAMVRSKSNSNDFKSLSDASPRARTWTGDTTPSGSTNSPPAK